MFVEFVKTIHTKEIFDLHHVENTLEKRSLRDVRYIYEFTKFCKSLRANEIQIFQKTIPHLKLMNFTFLMHIGSFKLSSFIASLCVTSMLFSHFSIAHKEFRDFTVVAHTCFFNLSSFRKSLCSANMLMSHFFRAHSKCRDFTNVAHIGSLKLASFRRKLVCCKCEVSHYFAHIRNSEILQLLQTHDPRVSQVLENPCVRQMLCVTLQTITINEVEVNIPYAHHRPAPHTRGGGGNFKYRPITNHDKRCPLNE